MLFLSLPPGLMQAILGCLGVGELAAVRRVCTSWRSIKSAWALLAFSPKTTLKTHKKVLDVCLGSALRHVAVTDLEVEFLASLASVAPRVEHLEGRMSVKELKMARTSFAAFPTLDRLELLCSSSADLDFPPSLRQLSLLAASPGMIPTTLERLEIDGPVLGKDADGVVKLCASPGSTPDLRSLSMRYVSRTDYGPLARRLLGSTVHKLDALVIKHYSCAGDPLDVVDAFPFDAAFRAACLIFLPLALGVVITMVSLPQGLFSWFQLANIEAARVPDLLRFAKFPRTERLCIHGCTQQGLEDCLKLRMTLDAWLHTKHGAVKVTVPRMEGITLKKLQLSGFAEVSFEGGFIPGRLKEIWLDERPSNVPADAVLSHESSFVVLRFRSFNKRS